MTAPDKPGLSNEELKPLPCPFCGGSAIFKRNEPGSESCKVICVPCLVVGPVRATRKAAIESWNRRAQSPPVAQVEVYRRALEAIAESGGGEHEGYCESNLTASEEAKQALLTSKPEPDYKAMTPNNPEPTAPTEGGKS